MYVPDIDVAIRFFYELMGAQVISDMSSGNIPDQWKEQFGWHKSSNLQRFVMLQMAGGAKLELLHYRGAEMNHMQPHGDGEGASHVALKTDDIDRSLALLKSRNVIILNDPITNPDGIRWFYFQTPWCSQSWFRCRVRVASSPQPKEVPHVGVLCAPRKNHSCPRDAQPLLRKAVSPLSVAPADYAFDFQKVVNAPASVFAAIAGLFVSTERREGVPIRVVPACC